MLIHDLKKHFFLPSFIILCALSLFSCGDKPAIDSKDVAQELNKPKSDLTKESDERFMVNAAEYHYKEILLGKLAQQRATDQRVKDLAKMMEDAHRESKSALGSLAIIKGIAIPTTPTQSAMSFYDMLNAKSMDEFDLEYCAMTIADHRDAINLFENATRGNNDPGVQDWASSILPSIRARLAQAEACEAHLNPLSELIR